jgi:hypothetical protein
VSDPGTPLILINGVGQTGLGFNWGDGFVTDSAILTNPPTSVSDPRGFFAADEVSTRGYRIVLAPHSYGPSVTGQAVASTFGSVLWERLSRSWGSKHPAADLAVAGIRQQYAGEPCLTIVEDVGS